MDKKIEFLILRCELDNTHREPSSKNNLKIATLINMNIQKNNRRYKIIYVFCFFNCVGGVEKYI